MTLSPNSTDTTHAGRVCFFGTFDQDGPRNRLLQHWITDAGYELDVCHYPLWGSGQRQAAARGIGLILLPWRLAWAYSVLSVRLLRLPRPDVILVGYAGYLDMFPARILATLLRVPVAYDVFVSLYDTVVSDRRIASSGSLRGRLARALDRWSCRMADRVFVDTPEHREFFSRHTRQSADRFRILWIGAEDSRFKPVAPPAGDAKRVLFYGTFVPLQGVPTIVEAAKRLEADGIQVRVIGHGQDSERVRQLVADLSPSNLELVDWVPYESLLDEIARADLCLGIFGTSEKSARVVPTKVFQCIAAGRPVLTADTPAIRQAFTPGTEIATCEPDPESLSRTIRELLSDSAKLEALGRAGRERYDRDYSSSALTQLVSSYLGELSANAR